MNEALFSTVHKKDDLSLYESGRPDYQKVVELLDFKKRDVSKASGVSEDLVRYDQKMPKELEERMTEWAAALAAVGEYFKDLNKTVLWFKIPNPLLGNVAPRDMIRVGRFHKLFRFILQALQENKR